MTKKKTVLKKATKKIAKKSSPRVAKKSRKKEGAEALSAAVTEGILEMKGKEITVMDLRGLPAAVCEFFIVCEGNSRTQVEAIADSIEVEVKKACGEKPWHKEGLDNAEWILLDYGNVVAHVFQPQPRAFYNLESLWADASITHLKN